MKAYLDNNVVCAIAKDDTPAESDALDRLLVAYEEAKVGLVTSELTLEEIKAYRRGVRSSGPSGFLKRYRSFGGISCWALTATATSTLGSIVP